MHLDRLSSTDAPVENPAPPHVQGSASHLRTNQYAQLKRLTKKNGLLDRQPAYYAGKTVFTLGLLAVSLALLFVLGDTRFQPRDRRPPILQRDLAAPPRGRRSAARSKKGEVAVRQIRRKLLGPGRGHRDLDRPSVQPLFLPWRHLEGSAHPTVFPARALFIESQSPGFSQRAQTGSPDSFPSFPRRGPRAPRRAQARRPPARPWRRSGRR
jgi:hypothetical protein